MPKIIDDFFLEPPKRPGEITHTLRDHQIRVLRMLGTSRGPMSVKDLGNAIGVTGTIVRRAVGYLDAAKRQAFESTAVREGGYASLITLGYVTHRTIEIEEDIKEVVYSITQAGREALQLVKDRRLDPPKNNYQK